MKKTLYAVICAAALLMTGCSKDAASNVVSDVSKFIEAEGRGYGQTYEKGMNEDNQTEFFKFKVTDAYCINEVSGFSTTDENYEFLCVHVELTNTFSESIPVGTYDFTVRWGDGEEDVAYAESQEDGFGEDNYPEDTTLAVGESAEGNVYFVVPKDSSNLKLEYMEYYEDDFEGNLFVIDLGKPAKG